MKATPNLLSVGALTYDTIFRFDQLPLAPGKYLPLEAVQGAAGMASSAATAARRYGADVSLWASVGQDAMGKILIQEMQAEGIDCSLIRPVPKGLSAMATILVDAQGERLIVPYYDPVTYAAPEDIEIQFGSYDAILVDTRWPGAAALALEAAQAHRIPGILDADVAPIEILHRLLPIASHIVASLPACQILFGAGADAATSAARLVESYNVFSAVTDGANGTFASTPGQTPQRFPAYKIQPVDTLAAGDIFHGVFAVALAETGDTSQAIQIAGAAAAIKCMRFGGRVGAPTRAETLEFIKAQKSG